MKLSKRKDVYHVLKAKSSFKNADVTVNGIPPNITVFVNQSICSYCKFLWSKYKKLWLNKVIESIWVSEDSYRITLKHDSVKIITHIEHLKCLVSWACNLGRKCQQFLIIVVGYTQLFCVLLKADVANLLAFLKIKTILSNLTVNMK